ncbi:MAG TPA: hypothetical protein VK995_02145, partial [Oceanipulchritudo sp.]|nr:hypothetical protein [Oceanipulchritudo sp.]
FKGLREPVITRIGMALVTLVSIVLAVAVPSVVDLYYMIGTLAVPGLLMPVLSGVGLVPRISPFLVRVHLAAVPALSACWYLTSHYIPGSLPAVEPFYPGCAASAIIWLTGWLRQRGKTD